MSEDKGEGIKKYGSILLKGTLAVSLANSTTKFAAFLFLPLFTYYLSPEDYGMVSMVSIVVTFLTLVYNPGMVSATMRMYHATDDEIERKTIIGSAYRFFIFFPVVFIILSIIFGPTIFKYVFTDFDFYPYGLLAVILAFFGQPKRIWVTLMTLQYKMHITAIYSVVSVLLGLLTTFVLVVIFKMGALGKVLGMFPTVLIFFVISFITIRKYTENRWSFKNMFSQLRFGFPLIIAIWSYEFLHIADRYILEKMTTMTAVGIYSFGYTLSEVPMMLVLGAKQLWNPIFYENMNKGNYDLISKLIKYFVGFMTLLNIMVILYSKELILLFINVRYAPTVEIIGVIVLGVYFNGLLTISNSVLAYKNKFFSTSIIATIATVINIGLNILLIPYLGILGSAIATLIAYFVYFMIGIIHQKETLNKIQKLNDTLVPILFIIASTVLTFITNRIYLNEVSWIEITIKTAFLLIFLVTLNRMKIFRKKEMMFLLDFITKKFKSKKK